MASCFPGWACVILAHGHRTMRTRPCHEISVDAPGDERQWDIGSAALILCRHSRIPRFALAGGAAKAPPFQALRAYLAPAMLCLAGGSPRPIARRAPCRGRDAGRRGQE